VILTAGSLRIETFEGSRPRLRRTRQGYGRSIDFDIAEIANFSQRDVEPASVISLQAGEVAPTGSLAEIRSL
jgi:hypothetical protein